MADNKKIIAGSSENSLFDVKLYIDGYPINWKSISTLVVREYIWQVIPTLELTIVDSGLFFEANPITEGSVVDIELSLKKENKPIIKNQFVVVGSTISSLNPVRNDLFSVSLIAAYKPIEYVYTTKNTCYSKMTSVDAITSIFKKNKDKVESKISSTDNMTWYQVNQNDNTAIQDIVSRSYISQDDSIVSFIDRNGEATITSFKTISLGHGLEMKWNPDKKSDIFSEDDNNLYMSSFVYKDASPYANMMGSSKVELTYYQDEDGTIKTETIKAPKFPITFFTNKSRGIEDIFTNNLTRGFTDNTHSKYHQSEAINSVIAGSYLSSYLLTNVKPDSRVKLMNKVELNMTGIDGITNTTYSGEYIITGIVHHISTQGTYQMSTMLSRPGLNKVVSSLYEAKLKRN